jgi:hypothetical protein
MRSRWGLLRTRAAGFVVMVRSNLPGPPERRCVRLNRPERCQNQERGNPVIFHPLVIPQSRLSDNGLSLGA